MERTIILPETSSPKPATVIQCVRHCGKWNLKKQYREVFYWKDKGEGDFVVQTGEGLRPVQVSYDTLNPGHEPALKEFYENFPQANGAMVFVKDDF